MASSKTQMINALKLAIKPVLEKYGGGGFAGWNGQPQEGSQNNAIKYPAVFWELVEIPWSNVGDQRGGTVQFTKNGEISFHICTQSHGDDPHVDTDIFDLADEVAAAIYGVNDDHFGSFYRIGESQDVQHEQVVDFIQTFRFGILDNTTFVNETSEWLFSKLEISKNIQT